MSCVTVRNLPDATHLALKQRAMQHGRSTEAETRHIPEAAAQPGKGLGSMLAAARQEAGGFGPPSERDRTVAGLGHIGQVFIVGRLRRQSTHPGTPPGRD